MYKTYQYILVPIVSLFSVTLMCAQEKDTIQTDVINVIKPYTPTISDAFKAKITPTLEDNSTVKKKTVDYNILSVPVASTFIPTKGKAAMIEREKPELFYENYLTIGYGSYGNLISELYVTKELNRIGSFGARITQEMSDGGIDGKILDDSFTDTNVELEYIKRQRDITWSIKGGLQRQKYNWYGIESRYENSINDNEKVSHNFYNLYAIGDVAFDYTYIKSASVTLRRFYDEFDSGENHLNFKGKVDLPVLDEEITTNVRLEYLNGHAGNRYTPSTPIPEYGNLLFGVAPSYQLRRDNLTLNIGASAYYMLGFEDTKSNLYLYPNITGSFRVVDDVVIAYGGLTGDVVQNSYRDFTQSNQFLSPTISVRPTDNSFNAYLGMLGKFTNDIGYNLKLGYTSEKDKPLFRKNNFPASGTTMNGSTAYEYGNSFTVVYDNIKTIHALAEVNVEMNRNFKMGLRAEYMNFNTEFEEEAWNLPSLKASVFGDYNSEDNWFAGAKIFYVGERKDQNVLIGDNVTTAESIITVDGYIDINLNAGYNISNRFTVFLNLNNIAGDSYERWSNYNVQGFQILGGATYKFDF
ncbi:TonB-dependent receptor [Formosa sediminum]|uniref:TonB-dependent receptor n=1 Tax=Formosa sediminum TaxID=2594004 RepID=A0A516GMD2_9FLAO|nr:TonB-dependent receptor [Formosa sediminum]QDO92540.1 TonB-dependent receptor [Formosa sediminum]